MTEDDKRLSTPMERMTWAFVASLASLAGLIPAALILHGRSATEQTTIGNICIAVATISIVVLTIATLVLYISLGTLALRLGLSVITWVGLPLITAQFGGPLVAYFMMRSRVIRVSPSKILSRSEQKRVEAKRRALGYDR